MGTPFENPAFSIDPTWRLLAKIETPNNEVELFENPMTIKITGRMLRKEWDNSKELNLASIQAVITKDSIAKIIIPEKIIKWNKKMVKLLQGWGKSQRYV